MSSPSEALQGVEAYIFDVFGTTVDWYGNITRSIAKSAEGTDEDWDAFAKEWRKGYFKHARSVADSGHGNTNMDIVHRQILDSMLESPRWKHLASVWDDAKRHELVLAWHRSDGWPDVKRGLYALKKTKIVAALSNGNMRFLVDVAKHADLPWDVVLSVDLFGTCKPNAKVYQGALHYLELPAEKCAMVAAHMWDLEAAAKHGMKTVYVPRPTDDGDLRDKVRSKADGGEVDVVVDSFERLAEIVSRTT
ncbi:haloacid dehalogenase [Pilatotrama ljubarskyi]|nr:haloacid dehalogenase [Pilatotrama ljubarskyi]